MAVLRINKLERIGKQRLEQGPLSIGRSLKNDMTLPHPSVSRNHCIIENEEGVTKIRDLDSRHGTTVNGKDITEAVLHDGDVIGLGIFELTFYDKNAPHLDDSHEIVLETFPDKAFGHDDALSGSHTGAALVPLPPDRTAELEAELTALRESRDSMQEQLTARRSELEKAREELTSLRAEFESKTQEHQEATEAIAAERDAARAETKEQLRLVEEQRQKADDFETKLIKQTAEALEQLKSFEAQRSDYDTRLKQHETEEASLRKQHEKAAKDLESKTSKFSEAQTTLAALKEEVKALKNQVGDLGGKSHEVDQFLTNLHHSAQQIMPILQKLATVKQSVQAIEGVYVQANELAESATATEADNLDEMLTQRDTVGEQLQAAHTQFDATVDDLQQVTTRICQYILSEEVRAALEQPAKRSFLSRLVKQ